MSEDHPDVHTLADHLFRRESGKMVSALTRAFGTRHLALAEDVVQEALARALRQWPFTGIPRNPAGWLYQVAKRKAIDVVRREQSFSRVASGDPDGLPPARAVEPVLESAFLDEEIKDDTLRMMFTCCHPSLPLESQIALTLKILGGFSSAEIARALLTQEPTIEKRLYRAKQRLRQERVAFEVPSGPELGARLRAVLAVLYLMFNEGYSASFADHPIRRDVCVEAMRLCKLVTEHPAGERPAALALMALMCLHAARFDARVDDSGHLLMLRTQDRSKWDQINRAIALAEVHGPQAAIDAVAGIPQQGALDSYPFFAATLGELHARLGKTNAAAEYLQRAIALTSSPADRRYLQGRLDACRALQD